MVENVTRHLEERPDQSVVEATEQAMAEITGPVVATSLVLVAVFAPVGFISGIIGALYRQFAVTISASIVISAINALTLSPALCALILGRSQGDRSFVFRGFNRGIPFHPRSVWRHGALPLAMAAAGGGRNPRGVRAGLCRPRIHPHRVSTRGGPGSYFYVDVQMPNGASLVRTERVVEQVAAMLRQTPGVAHTIELAWSKYHCRRARTQRRVGYCHHAALERAR